MTAVVIDTSAAVAILTGEATGAAMIAALDDAERRLMSAATFVELGIVLEARIGPVGAAIADRFVSEGAIDVVAFDSDQAQVAVNGWRRFGKGRHSAGLNYGDCFTYALAISEDAPVLFVGDDFSHTDVDVASARSPDTD